MKTRRAYKPGAMATTILEDLSRGRPGFASLRGQSNHGGAVWALVALRKHGFLDGNELTAKGRAAVAQSQADD